MRIAVLSGKGGTGKTTVSASLALSLGNYQYVDSDVEEPNGGIFLNPKITDILPVNVKVPAVDENKCTGCGICSKTCQFNAIAVIKGMVLLFSEICHHCGACIIACPEVALYEIEKTIGVIEKNEDATFMQGKLNIGEPISIPIIQKLKDEMNPHIPIIIDCPPGASCNVVESSEGCDYGILVTEPTPFWLHDLKIAVKLVEKMGIPFAVVINKSSKDSKIIHKFCDKNKIDILLEIPFSRDIAEAYSKGRLPVHENAEWKEKFRAMYEKIKRGVNK